MTFSMTIKHEGKKIQKAKVQRIEDFDPIIDGLKEKFGSRQRRRR